jgi:5,10-methylenetetrahydrofolate reductase
MNKVQGFAVPVIAGIVILKSAAMASFMNENVAGISVPENLIREMAQTSKEDVKKKAVEIAARIIRQVKPVCQGVHIMALGWENLIPEIIKEAQLGSEVKTRQKGD